VRVRRDVDDRVRLVGFCGRCEGAHGAQAIGAVLIDGKSSVGSPMSCVTA
jgi:hypothetical protein